MTNRFQFDPAKEAANVAKHGLSFADAAEFDLLTASTVVDDRRDYGEIRFRAYNRIEGRGFCLVFTEARAAPGELRVIGFRRAHEKEMRRHGK